MVVIIMMPRWWLLRRIMAEIRLRESNRSRKILMKKCWLLPCRKFSGHKPQLCWMDQLIKCPCRLWWTQRHRIRASASLAKRPSAIILRISPYETIGVKNSLNIEGEMYRRIVTSQKLWIQQEEIIMRGIVITKLLLRIIKSIVIEKIWCLSSNLSAPHANPRLSHLAAKMQWCFRPTRSYHLASCHRVRIKRVWA